MDDQTEIWETGQQITQIIIFLLSYAHKQEQQPDKKKTRNTYLIRKPKGGEKKNPFGLNKILPLIQSEVFYSEQ